MNSLNIIIYGFIFWLLFYAYLFWDKTTTEGLSNKGIISELRRKKNKHINRPFRKFTERMTKKINNIHKHIQRKLF
jgi:hypothetical protein